VIIYKPSKLGQTVQVFGLQSEFINGSLPAGFLINTQMHRRLLTSYTINFASHLSLKVLVPTALA